MQKKMRKCDTSNSDSRQYLNSEGQLMPWAGHRAAVPTAASRAWPMLLQEVRGSQEPCGCAPVLLETVLTACGKES